MTRVFFSSLLSVSVVSHFPLFFFFPFIYMSYFSLFHIIHSFPFLFIPLSFRPRWVHTVCIRLLYLLPLSLFLSLLVKLNLVSMCSLQDAHRAVYCPAIMHPSTTTIGPRRKQSNLTVLFWKLCCVNNGQHRPTAAGIVVASQRDDPPALLLTHPGYKCVARSIPRIARCLMGCVVCREGEKMVKSDWEREWKRDQLL